MAPPLPTVTLWALFREKVQFCIRFWERPSTAKTPPNSAELLMNLEFTTVRFTTEEELVACVLVI